VAAPKDTAVSRKFFLWVFSQLKKCASKSKTLLSTGQVKNGVLAWAETGAEAEGQRLCSHTRTKKKNRVCELHVVLAPKKKLGKLLKGCAP
jgi:hypothetical protein